MPFSSISFYLFEILFLPTELRSNEPRLVTEPTCLTSACLLSVISSWMQANFVKLNWQIRDDHNWSPNPPTKTATANPLTLLPPVANQVRAHLSKQHRRVYYIAANESSIH